MDKQSVTKESNVIDMTKRIKEYQAKKKAEVYKRILALTEHLVNKQPLDKGSINGNE